MEKRVCKNDRGRKNIHKNKLIITVAVLVLVFAVMAYILLNSTTNDTLYFHYIHNQNTGESLGLIASILLYILFWWFVGLVPSSSVFLFVLCLYYFLHRKDKRILDRYYHPKYEEEFYYGGLLSLAATYIAILVLMILHISNIITINAF